MINFTLTITAAPELLAAISTFTNSITSAKVVTIPQTNSDFSAIKEQIAAAVTYSQPEPQADTYQAQVPSVQQTIPNQLPVQNQTPTNAMPTYNQHVSGQAYQVQPQQQATNQMSPTQGAIVPTSAQTYTMEQLAVAATQLVDAGRRTELVGLLSSFGVQALTALPKERYGEFATQLRALGAKI